MSNQVTHFKCLLISPSDVQQEREAARQAIARFNAHTGNGLAAIVEIVGWELHTFPDLSGSPQEKINEQILDSCDFGIAIFWSRVGTPTVNHRSGSVEEIELLLAKGKKVLAYFCDRDVPRNAQLDDVNRLREAYQARGLVAGFGSAKDLELAVFTALGGLVPKLMHEPSQQLPNPNVRVTATFGKIVEVSKPDTAYPALQVCVENHSPRPLYLSQLSLEGKGLGTMTMLDAYRQPVKADRTIDSGDSFKVTLDANKGFTKLPWLDCVATDKIGRRFMPAEGVFLHDLEEWNRWLDKNQITEWRRFRGIGGAYFMPVKSIPSTETGEEKTGE